MKDEQEELLVKLEIYIPLNQVREFYSLLKEAGFEMGTTPKEVYKQAIELADSEEAKELILDAIRENGELQ